MARTGEKARKVALEIKAELKAERAVELYDYIEDHPGETAYSLSKNMRITLRTVQSLLKDLEEENLVKIAPMIEKGRSKKKIYVMGLKDYTFDNYNEEEIDEPLLDKIITKVKEENITAFIHRKNGDTIQLVR